MQDLNNKIKELSSQYYDEILSKLDFLNDQQEDPSIANKIETSISSLYKNDFEIPRFSFSIGGVMIKNPVVSAPLAGISDNTYRIFSGVFGSALNFTEMISSYGVHYGGNESISLARISSEERPCGVQIFGSEPEIMLEAAQKLEGSGDLIDINMGCPVPKVLKSRSGGYLLQDEEKVGEIIRKVSSGIKKPLTVKIRIGWNKNNINAVSIAKIAEFNGASAITVHGRTVKQGFSGETDYGTIRQVKESVSIPVIASGDIDTPLKSNNVIKDTGCDAVMLGRALKGRHWILPGMLAGIDIVALESGPLLENVTEPSLGFRKKYADLYLKSIIKFRGEEKALREFRKVLIWIFKGVRSISRYKNDFFKLDTAVEAAKLINSINP